MSKLIDLSGQKFDRLTVIKREENSKDGHARWLCICDCGNTKVINGSNLLNKNVRSCGCLQQEITTLNLEQRFKHGYHNTPTYQTWECMIQRCSNPNVPSYQYYGGRGIRVCQRWLDDFKNFLSDMGERPNGKTLDRIDNEDNYYPENCRWATPKEQSENKRRKS